MLVLLGQVVARLRFLLRCRWLVALAAGCALAGVALTRLPLFEVPGWELATGMAVLLTVFGGAAGIRAARAERGTHSEPRLAAAFWSVVALELAVLALPLAAAVAGTVTSTRCNPWSGALFYLLIPVPTALLCAAVGLAVGFAVRRAWAAGLLYAAAVLTSLGLSLWPLYAGPQVFALNHFLGYFPGPLYDESLAIDARLIVYRALTLVWCALVLAATAAALRMRRGRRAPTALLATCALLAVALGLAHARRDDLDLERSTAALEKRLGGRAETAHFVLHYPRSKPRRDVERLERDLEFDYARTTAFLGSAPAGKVDAWFYRSPEEKQRLVGAAGTNFAKPWRREFHVHDEPFPHPVARHEMSHVIAGSFGSPVFGVSARAVVAVNIGLVEGLAVAADDPVDDLTLHEWAAAMRRLHLAPDVRGIVNPAGFYQQSAARAYTAAGSFLRFLADRHGAAGLRALYPAGNFAQAFGAPLDALVAEWEAFLDAMPLSPRALRTAELRFERGSLFQRPCAREVALLKDEAAELRESEPDHALALYERCAAIEPGNPAFARGRAELLRARQDWAGARAIWEKLLADPAVAPATQAQAMMELGDLAWDEGDLAAARAQFGKALALGRDRAFERTLTAKLAALDDELARDPVRRFFLKPDLPEVVALSALANSPAAPVVAAAGDGAPARSFAPLARYLVGRQLVMRNAPAAALEYLAPAPGEIARAESPGAVGGLPSRELELERLRMLLKAAYLAADLAQFDRAADELSRQGDASDRAMAEEWRARAKFELETWGRLLSAPR